MSLEFKLPDLGENITSAGVLSVLVKPGDTIFLDTPVLEIETDKATIEVPSSVAGTVSSVLVKAGDKAQVGQVVLTLDHSDAEKPKPITLKVDDPPPAAEPPKVEPPKKASVPKPLVSLGTDGFGRSDTRRRLREFFEVDHRFVVIGTLAELVRQGKVNMDVYKQAITDLEVDVNKLNPMIS